MHRYQKRLEVLLDENEILKREYDRQLAVKSDEIEIAKKKLSAKSMNVCLFIKYL